MRSIYIFLFLVLVFNKPLAQSIPVEAYANNPATSMFRVSPNGTLVAFRDNTTNQDILAVYSLKEKKITNTLGLSDIKPNNFYFINQETVILNASKNMTIPGYLGRHNMNLAFSYNLKKDKVHQLLTPGFGIYEGQSDVGTILGISEDKKYAYMPAYKNDTIYSLFKVNLKREAKPQVSQSGWGDTTDFFLNDNNKVIARERFSNKKNLHRIESKLSGKWKTVYEEKTQYPTKSFSGLTPNKKNLVMLGLNKNTGRQAYYTLSLIDGTIKGPLFQHKDKDVERTLTSDDRIVHGVQYSGFTPSYDFFDETLNKRIRGIQAILPNQIVRIIDYTKDWNHIVVHAVGEKNSGGSLLYSNGKLTPLSSSHPNIPPKDVNQIIEYTYKTRDGLTIPTLLTLPNGKELKNLPAIMMPHGGPEAYDTIGFNYRAQFFASQGYLVIQPQFRGSEGFGFDHLIAGRGEWGRKMQDDLTDAVLTLAKEGKINKDRVCIVGGSYGGYAALAGAAFTPDLYKCAISINGVSDVYSMTQTEKKEHGSDHWVVAYWEDVISKGDFDKNHLKEISPINFVTQIKTPILLIHGEYDKIVPKKQSEKMAKKLKKAKKNVTYIKLPKGDHHLSDEKNRVQAMQAIAKFVNEHI